MPVFQIQNLAPAEAAYRDAYTCFRFLMVLVVVHHAGPRFVAAEAASRDAYTCLCCLLAMPVAGALVHVQPYLGRAEAEPGEACSYLYL